MAVLGGMCSEISNEPHGVSLWKHIRGGSGKFSRNLRYEVGRGFRICFWNDMWCGELPLKEGILAVVSHCKE